MVGENAKKRATQTMITDSIRASASFDDTTGDRFGDLELWNGDDQIE
ncbi:hypothetical protein VB711_25005 [Cronbergia sp. UHCC 0137]|nr:hypothetical protein [Cronbergia sp. UHCC 0137]MEA5621067.1 hypothetical protein [Cronbergia sp. UHCC 0137]